METQIKIFVFLLMQIQLSISANVVALVDKLMSNYDKYSRPALGNDITVIYMTVNIDRLLMTVKKET
jgi:hypothetical protein